MVANGNQGIRGQIERLVASRLRLMQHLLPFLNDTIMAGVTAERRKGSKQGKMSCTCMDLTRKLKRLNSLDLSNSRDSDVRHKSNAGVTPQDAPVQ